MILDKSGYMEILQNNIATVVRESAVADVAEIDRRLDELQQELMKRANNKQGYDQIADEIFRLRDLKAQAESSGQQRDEKLSRITDLFDFLDEQPQRLTELDETLVRRLVQRITVFYDRVTVEFKSGVSVDIEE